MTYIPPERTPRQPPIVWKSEQERRVWFAKNGIPGVGLKSGDMMPVPYTQEQIDEIHRKSISQRLLRLMVAIIDWLNGLTGAEKPKHKTNGEQMATLAELFEGYEEDVPRAYRSSHPGWFGDAGKRKIPIVPGYTVELEAPPAPPAPPQPPTRDVTRR